MGTEGNTPPGPDLRETLSEQGIILHRTYVGAAVQLHYMHPDLVTASDLAEITADAVREFDRLRVMHPDKEQSHWHAFAETLTEDVVSANAVMTRENLQACRHPTHFSTLSQEHGWSEEQDYNTDDDSEELSDFSSVEGDDTLDALD